jgi:hypothetical protein
MTRCRTKIATVALGLLAACGGCQRGASGPDRDAAGLPGPLDGGYALTAERLDAFIRYQTRLVALYDQLLWQDGGPRPGRIGDGGVDPVRAQIRLFEGKARAEEQAREDAGLTEEEVARIEPMVASVISTRQFAQEANVEATLKQYEAMREKVRADQRDGLEDTIAELKATHQEQMGNVEERQRYGGANVDLVLTREEELSKVRKEWLKRIAGM